MDIANLFPIAQPLPITFPDGSPTGITLKVLGQDSKAFRDVAKRIAKLTLGADTKVHDLDVLEAQNAELFASCIVGWSGLTEGGVELPYSAAKALELMSMPELSFIREQVEAFVAKRANFFRSGAEAA